ncbi:bifunctional molybdenum cofactor biosynthesis protein MoaC/MoaB [Lysobacter humi (ex Lee et al. 2017)]
MSGEAFHMADIRGKRPTRRRAVAVGELHAGVEAFAAIVERRLPKGDALVMAEIAGLQGAKQASALMPLCHPLLLELVRVRCMPVPERHAIRVYCEVATEARTGVEMEALAGASAALLTLYDLTKPVEPALSIEAVRLLFKEGGKKGAWRHPDGMTDEEVTHYRPRSPVRLDGIACAVVTLSDRAHAGSVQDVSGPALTKLLQDAGAVVTSACLPDGVEPLRTHLRSLAAQGQVLCLCTGGTGLGPRDLTPEALDLDDARDVPGVAELFRSESAHFTPLAWLSRARAVQLDGMLVIALPGSPRAVAQAWEILAPLLTHALSMASGDGHP